MVSKIIIGIDVGLTGGLTIIDGSKTPSVHPMPLKKIVVNKKDKRVYDMVAIVAIFKKYVGKDVVFVIEKQGVRQGEGTVSAMTIGKGFGQLLGAGFAFEFEVIEVTPQSWKKDYPELITDEMRDIKDEMKALRYEAKKIEGNEDKKENKKHVDKLGRKFKSLAKTEARGLASKLFPILSDKFVKVNTDGMAESVLIALYGKNKFA